MGVGIRDDKLESRGAHSSHAHTSWVPSDALLGRLLARSRRQHQEALKVVGEVLQPDLGPRSNPTNGSNEVAAHGHDLVAEHMFVASSNPAPTLIRLLLVSGQGFVAIPLY